MAIAYRLKHKRTGLYFCCSREVCDKSKPGVMWKWYKSNLSKKGKAWLQKPSISWYESYYDERGIFQYKRGAEDFELEVI